MPVVRPEKNRESRTTGVTSPSEGARDRELADWTVGHACVFQDGSDQAQRRGQENDSDEQRAFDEARCVKHDTDDQGEQRAQAERFSGQAGARPAKVADVDLQTGEEEQERQPDRRHQPYRLVRLHQVQYRWPKHDPGDDLKHRPGDRHPRHGRENQRHRRRDRKHGDEIVEVHRGHHPPTVFIGSRVLSAHRALWATLAQVPDPEVPWRIPVA